MWRAGVVTILVFPLVLSSEELAKPDKVPINTWVREDIFAGYLAEDLPAFERGERKLDRFLQDHPEDATALAWKAGATMFRMRQAVKKGDMESYRSLRKTEKELQEHSLRNVKSPEDIGPNIIIGGSLILTAVFLPDADRAEMYRTGRELLRDVPGRQKIFDNLPPHMRGELWSQIALASDRLGDKEERDRVLAQMLNKLQGTPYENRARRWQKQEEIKTQADHTCISCHDPGRLTPTLARLAAQ